MLHGMATTTTCVSTISFPTALQVQDTKAVTLFTGMLQSLKEYVAVGIDLDSFFITIGEVFHMFLCIVVSDTASANEKLVRKLVHGVCILAVLVVCAELL